MTGLVSDCLWTWEMRASSLSVRTPPIWSVVPAGLHLWKVELTLAFLSQIMFKVSKKKEDNNSERRMKYMAMRNSA